MTDNNTVNITIDGQEATVPTGVTILDAAAEQGIDIPHICYHEGVTAPAVCRMCVVEVEGARVLAAGCVAQVGDGMVIDTRSERVETSRRTILEMLNSTVDLSEAPDIQEMMGDYDADPERFAEGKAREFEIKDDNPFYLRDYNQCVMCWRCVLVCADDGQYAFALNFGERGFESHIATFFDDPMPDTTCVFCGLCVDVCPTGALKPKTQWGMEQGMNRDEIRAITRRAKRRKKTD